MPSRWCPAQKSREPFGNPKEACKSHPLALHRPLRETRVETAALVSPDLPACTPSNPFASVSAAAPTLARAFAPVPTPAPTPEAAEVAPAAAPTPSTTFPFSLTLPISLWNGAPPPRITGVLVIREGATASDRSERAPGAQRLEGGDEAAETHRWRLEGGAPEGFFVSDPVAADTAAAGFLGTDAVASTVAAASAAAAAFLSFLLSTTRLTMSGS